MIGLENERHCCLSMIFQRRASRAPCKKYLIDFFPTLTLFLGEARNRGSKYFFFRGVPSGKNLEDGDDYQLIDMGEESLFLPENDRLGFLNAVFAKRPTN